MTPAWDELISNPEQLTALYSKIPSLEEVVLRSVHVNIYGPTLTTRIELFPFPDHVPADWAEAGCDRFELQLRFALGCEENLRMHGLPTGRPAAIRYQRLDKGWLRVAIRGEDCELGFTCYDELQVAHLNAYRSTDGDPYTARRWFVNHFDQRLYRILPPPTKKPFYDT